MVFVCVDFVMLIVDCEFVYVVDCELVVFYCICDLDLIFGVVFVYLYLCYIVFSVVFVDVVNSVVSFVSSCVCDRFCLIV